MTRLSSLISASKFIINGSRWLFAVALGGAVVAGLFPAVGVLALQRTVEAASNGRLAWAQLALLASSMLAMTIVSRIADLAANEAARRAVARARRTFISQLATITDLAQYGNPAFHDRIEAARSALDVGVGQYPNHLVNVLTSLTTVVAIAATLSQFNPLVAVLAVLVIVPAWIGDRYVARRQVAFVAEISASDRERVMLEDASRRLPVAVEGFVYQGWVALRHRYGAATDRVNQRELRANLAMFWAEIARSFVIGAMFFSAAAIAIASITAEGVATSAGAAAAAVAGLTAVFGATQNWSGAVANLFEAALRWQMFEAAFQTGPVDHQLKSSTFDAPRSPRWPAPSRVTFEDVWFRYDDDGPWVLKDINLELQAGDLVSLVGPNGAGKSTLVRLLCGFLTPTKGRVLWDGVDLAGNIDPSLWRHISLVMQDFPTYEYTLFENVILGRANLGEEEVRSVLHLVGLSDLVESAPSGLDTMVSMLVWGDEDAEASGIELSGGQWQRLALARALIEQRGLTVADEPNSALDPTAELDILGALRVHASSGIGLIVSHRLTSLRPEDRVVLIEDGCLAGDGQHRELWATNDAYQGFFGGQISAVAKLNTWSD